MSVSIYLLALIFKKNKMNTKQALLIFITVNVVLFLCYLNYKNCARCPNESIYSITNSAPVSGQVLYLHPRDYQIDIHNDTIWLYDGKRLVGKVLNKWNSPLDSLILKDNN